ncbi:hypothetical protein E5D57_012786 [Metarhizium anisopliae]|nr:hypothetical protein E5D57_012786 [Metarhizium anisopliae]
MAGYSANVTGPTLSESYREGLELFREFLLALSEDDCRVIHLEQYDPIAGSDHDSISSVSADSDIDSDGDVKYQYNRMPKIRLLVQQILEQIRSLYDLSALLRRQKITDKYISSIDSKPSAPGNSSNLPLSICLSSADESHVVEKVLQWRGWTKSVDSVKSDDENFASRERRLTDDRVKDILWLCRRLARANTRRREQLQYWADHPYDCNKDKHNFTGEEIENREQIPTKLAAEGKESRSQASTLKPPSANVQSEGPNSIVSKQGFSTAAVSDVYDTRTNIRARTVYTPTAVGQSRSNSVPNPPNTKNGVTTFPCPYCGMILESGEMENRQSWK